MDEKIFEKATSVDLFESLSVDEKEAADIRARVAVAFHRARITKQMSQKEFAQYLGVTQGTVSKWESGEQNFSLNSLVKPFSKLGLSIRIVPSEIVNRTEQVYAYPAPAKSTVMYTEAPTRSISIFQSPQQQFVYGLST